MRKILLILPVIFLLFAWSCKENTGPLPPDPTIKPEVKVKFVQTETEGGYQIEGSVPWSDFDLSPQAGSKIGFELLLTDDDDGGLRDFRLAWHTDVVPDSIATPADFGKLTLVDELSANGQNEVSRTGEIIQINGLAETAWAEAQEYLVEQELEGVRTDPTDFSATFQALWDSSGLYLLIQITDEGASTDSRSLRWEDDGVALWLDPENNGATAFNDQEHIQFRLVRNDRVTYVNDFSSSPEWTLPRNEILDGGPGKDGIPALLDPLLVLAQDATYLTNGDLILGYKMGDEVRAYPHKILDWHEIINDQINGFPFAVTYCPLTGTGIGWERTINRTVTTFGVSGLLYNTNLIPYDRLTDSNWSQIRLDCVNGSAQGILAKTVELVETTWGNWKEMYPQSKVVSDRTGWSRDYQLFPYGNYRTDHSIIFFPISPSNPSVAMEYPPGKSDNL